MSLLVLSTYRCSIPSSEPSMLSCDRNWKILLSLMGALSELQISRGAPAARVLQMAIALHYGPQVDGELSVLQAYQLKGMLALSARALVLRPDQQGVLDFFVDVRCTWLVHQRCVVIAGK